MKIFSCSEVSSGVLFTFARDDIPEVKLVLKKLGGFGNDLTPSGNLLTTHTYSRKLELELLMAGFVEEFQS